MMISQDGEATFVNLLRLCRPQLDANVDEQDTFVNFPRISIAVLVVLMVMIVMVSVMVMVMMMMMMSRTAEAKPLL